MPDFLSKIKGLISGGCWSPPKKPDMPIQQPTPQPTEPQKPMPRKLNQAGRVEIQSHEGLELEAYPDPASALGKACTAKNMRMRAYRKIEGWEKLSGSPWTIGYGHTGKMLDGSPVAAGSKITKEEAEELFDLDVAHFEAGVERLVKVPITDNQFAALVSFAYNVGLDEDEDTKAEGLGDSTLLRKLNAGDYSGAADSFLDWAKVKNKQTGEITLLKGLAKRRGAERDLFLKKD